MGAHPYKIDAETGYFCAKQQSHEGVTALMKKRKHQNGKQ
jgi:hypothetical protein